MPRNVLNILPKIEINARSELGNLEHICRNKFFSCIASCGRVLKNCQHLWSPKPPFYTLPASHLCHDHFSVAAIATHPLLHLGRGWSHRDCACAALFGLVIATSSRPGRELMNAPESRFLATLEEICLFFKLNVTNLQMYFIKRLI